MPRRPSPVASWTTLPGAARESSPSSTSLWGDSDDEEQLIPSSQPSPKKESSRKRKAVKTSIDKSSKRARVPPESAKESRTKSTAPKESVDPNTTRERKEYTSSSAGSSKSHLHMGETTPTKMSPRTPLNINRDVPHIDFTKIPLSLSAARKKPRHHFKSSYSSESPSVRSRKNEDSTKLPTPHNTARPQQLSKPSSNSNRTSSQNDSICEPTKKSKNSSTVTEIPPISPPSPSPTSYTTRPTTKSTTAECTDSPKYTLSVDNWGYMEYVRYPTPPKTLPPESPLLEKSELLLPVEGAAVSMNIQGESDAGLPPLKTEVYRGASALSKEVTRGDGGLAKDLEGFVRNANTMVESGPGSSAHAKNGGTPVRSLTAEIFARSCAWVGHDINIPYASRKTADANSLKLTSNAVEKLASSSSLPLSQEEPPDEAKRSNAHHHLPSPVSPLIENTAPSVPAGWTITSEEIQAVQRVINAALGEDSLGRAELELLKSPESEFELLYPP